jgi:hypothetical protein
VRYVNSVWTEFDFYTRRRYCHRPDRFSVNASTPHQAATIDSADAICGFDRVLLLAVVADRHRQ